MSKMNQMTRRRLMQTSGAAVASQGILLTQFSVAGAAETINVVTTSSTLTNTLFNVLKSQNFLEKFGVAMETIHVADGTMTVPALMGGQSDLCVITGIGLAIAAVAKGAPIKIVGSNCLLSQETVYSAKHDVKTVKDLEGKTVATSAVGSLTYQLMVALLQKKGVDVSKVTFHNAGSNTDIFRAVAAGTVDAGPSGIDVYNEQAQYGVHSLTDGNFWTELTEYTYQGAYASNHAIATKRDGLVRVLAALGKMFQFIQAPESKEAFIAARAQAVGKSDVKAALDTWDFFQKYKPYAPDLRLSEARVDYMQKLNVQFGTQGSVAPYADLVDMSLARDAVKLAGL